MKEETQKLAKAILLAQDIRERSWTYSPGKEHGFYTTDHDEAAKQACEKLKMDNELIQVVYLLNVTAWNNVQIWAKEILGLTPQ